MRSRRRGYAFSDLRPYGTNLHDRARVAGLLMLLSVPVAVAATLGVEALLPQPRGDETSVFVFVSPPSFIATFTLLLKVYDEYLWRMAPFGQRLSAVPNLNGVWLGYVTIESETRAEEPPGRIPCHVEIHQTWSRISLDFETDFTTSSLLMAAINRGKSLEGGFHYEYVVTPKLGTELERSGMGLHVGTARLSWDEPDPDCLEGYFYNGLGYQRYGQYHLDRDPDKQTAAQWRRRSSASPVTLPEGSKADPPSRPLG